MKVLPVREVDRKAGAIEKFPLALVKEGPPFITGLESWKV